jgi:DNA-binding NtrC family response regulator
MTHHKRVLVVDDEPLMRSFMERFLGAKGYQVVCADDGLSAIDHLVEPFDLVISDMRMPGADGHQVLEFVRERWPVTPVILMTAFGSIPDAVTAMRIGAFDYLTKPLPSNEELLSLVERALASSEAASPDASPPRADDEAEADHAPRAKAITDEVAPVPRRGDLAAWRTRYAPGIIGDSPTLLEALEMATHAADCDCPVLITGESGTGKEMLAEAFHYANTERASGPFVAVNCPAIPKELVESELFGHTKGAFTGATSARVGRFQAADNGTLFLDEIGEMDAGVQSKLLRVLQDFRVIRVGEIRGQKVDVRVIAATNRDLEEMVGKGAFREDLFYRLNVIRVHLPPLRDRKEDIPLLIDHFLKALTKQRNLPPPIISDDVREMLCAYSWPGNIRELRNILERLVILCAGRPVEPKHLPLKITGVAVSSDPDSEPDAFGSFRLPAEGLNLRNMLQRLEESMIKQALVTTGGNKNQAAKILGLNRTTLVEKLRKKSGSAA